MNEIKKINETYNILSDLKRDFIKNLATEAVDPGPNVDFKDGAVKNSYPSRDNINQQLLKDIQDAAKAANVNVSITTAQSGHESLPSRHPSGNAVDIAIINGKNVSLANRSDADQFVNALVKMGYVKNSETNNPKAVLTFGFPKHDDHVHVSNTGNSLPNQPSSEDKDDIFGVKNLDPNDPDDASYLEMGKQLGLKEEKIYSQLGNRTSDKSQTIIIPSSSNRKIKSPVKGVINNYRPNRSCDNQITIEYEIGGKTHYLQYCGISNPEIRDGGNVSKGDILGTTSSDVTVSLYDKGWNRLNLHKNRDEKISNDTPKSVNKKNNKGYSNGTQYIDPFYPWLGKKILGIGKKIHDKIPSTTKGEVPKIKDFFNKYGMTSKKVNENIERIKTLLK
jgi:hypothetical protein